MKWDWNRKQEKRSEELLRSKSSDDRENRPALTGYKPRKKEEPSLRETMRMENSLGILALGGDERKRPTLVATEKSRPREAAVEQRERTLQEEGKREYPVGQNRVIVNPGSREEGAVGFQLHPGMTRSQIMAQMKRHMDEHEQKTLEHMLPFLVTKKELSVKEKLEEALEEARRREQRESSDAGQREQRGAPDAWQREQQRDSKAVQEESVKLLERCLAKKKEELVRKRQTEMFFGQRLEKAVQEEKETVWKDNPDWKTAVQRRNAAEEAEEPADEPAAEKTF